MSQTTTDAKRTMKKYVPRTPDARGDTRTTTYVHTTESAGEFYARVTQQKDVRTILKVSFSYRYEQDFNETDSESLYEIVRRLTGAAFAFNSAYSLGRPYTSSTDSSRSVPFCQRG